jgi:hypothetical protein
MDVFLSLSRWRERFDSARERHRFFLRVDFQGKFDPYRPTFWNVRSGGSRHIPCIGIPTAEHIRNRKLFHITAVKPYKQPLIVGQTLTIGDAHNPFFQFCESPRQYPVQHNGEVVHVPAIAWLPKCETASLARTQTS